MQMTRALIRFRICVVVATGFCVGRPNYHHCKDGGFPGPPSFITELEDVRVSKGRPVVLTCDVKGAESVSWYKDGIIQRNAPDFKQTFDGKSARLEIMEVFMDDYGTYTCAIKNSKAECRCSCKIFVKGSESDDMFAPVFLKKLENQTVEEQETVSMECDVIGSQPIITWYLDGKTIPVGDKFRVSYDGKTAKLTLKCATRGDSGRFECSAENSAGRISCDCLLIVKEPVCRKVHRIYGSVCFLQIMFGTLMLICGILAVVARVDGGTPYFIFAFLSAILILGAGICSLYIFCTKAALPPAGALSETAIHRRRLCLIGDQVLSALCIFACLLGAFACGMFAYRKCDASTWWSICEFASKQLVNKVISTVLLVFLVISAIISCYYVMMSQYYSWVFVKNREKQTEKTKTPSGYPEVFAASTDSSFVDDDTRRHRSYGDDSENDIIHENISEPEREGLLAHDQSQDQARLRHLQMQQTTGYVDVLNDPAMKLKLMERSSRIK